MKGKLLNDLLVKKRIEKDYSQKDISEMTGVSLNIIKAVETGRMIGNEKNLEKLCEVLDLKVNEIYFPNFRNTHIIAVVQNKGGDGKTSLTSSLGYALTEYGNKDTKVLLIDANPQINLTRSFGMESLANANLGTAIEHDEDLINFIQPTDYNNIDMIVAHPSMSALEMLLLTKIERENCLKNVMRSIIEAGIYDYIFIDTDNHLGMLNYNILNASEFLIIPVCFAAFSLDGLETLLKHIRLVKRTNVKLEIAGIVVNKYDLRKKQTNADCEKVINDIFKDVKMFKTKIGLDSTIEHAQFNNIPVILQDKNSRIAKQYRELAKEVIKVVENR